MHEDYRMKDMDRKHDGVANGVDFSILVCG